MVCSYTEIRHDFRKLVELMARPEMMDGDSCTEAVGIASKHCLLFRNIAQAIAANGSFEEIAQHYINAYFADEEYSRVADGLMANADIVARVVTFLHIIDRDILRWTGSVATIFSAFVLADWRADKEAPHILFEPLGSYVSEMTVIEQQWPL